MKLHDIPADRPDVITREMLEEAADRLGRNAAWTMDRFVGQLRLPTLTPEEREFFQRQRRDGARHVVRRLNEQIFRWERAGLRPRDLITAALIVTPEEWHLLRTELAWWELRELGFPGEAEQMAFRGWPLRVER